MSLKTFALCCVFFSWWRWWWMSTFEAMFSHDIINLPIQSDTAQAELKSIEGSSCEHVHVDVMTFKYLNFWSLKLLFPCISFLNLHHTPHHNTPHHTTLNCTTISVIYIRWMTWHRWYCWIVVVCVLRQWVGDFQAHLLPLSRNQPFHVDFFSCIFSF